MEKNGSGNRKYIACALAHKLPVGFLLLSGTLNSLLVAHACFPPPILKSICPLQEVFSGKD